MLSFLETKWGQPMSMCVHVCACKNGHREKKDKMVHECVNGCFREEGLEEDFFNPLRPLYPKLSLESSHADCH